MFDKNTRLTQTQVCYLLGIEVRTIRRWYEYINTTPPEEIPETCPGLPTPTIAGKNGQKFFTQTDLHQLYDFQQWIPKGRGGVMGRISEQHWGFIKKKQTEKDKTL